LVNVEKYQACYLETFKQIISCRCNKIDSWLLRCVSICENRWSLIAIHERQWKVRLQVLLHELKVARSICRVTTFLCRSSQTSVEASYSNTIHIEGFVSILRLSESSFEKAQLFDDILDIGQNYKQLIHFHIVIFFLIFW